MKKSVIAFIFLALAASEALAQQEVEKWKRLEVSYSNTSWSGNPFDLPFTGMFISPTGRVFNHFGYYAGDDIWKINFMPDEVGEWTFRTTSTDNDLDGQAGSFSVVVSELPGPLKGDGNRWKLEDSGQYVIPIMLPSREYFKSTETADGINDFIDWSKDIVGARVIGTTLIYFNHAPNASPYINGQEGVEFNIPMWDRLQSHYDYLRDRGMGHYIMFYSDDGQAPTPNGVGPQSVEEIRLFRYTIARFAAYPTVMWDTGIDIGETRTNTWIHWFADYFNENDPWQHPVSSRAGGGSGGTFPNNASYYSDGDKGVGSKGVPTRTDLLSRWEGQSVPTAYTDRFREDYNRGDWDKDSIRKVTWRMGLTGGMAVYLSGSDNGGYLTSSYASDLESGPSLGFSATFFEEMVQNFGSLNPHDELVTGDQAILSANIGQEYIVYDENGGTITVDLSSVDGQCSFYWFNPRTGIADPTQVIQGGSVQTFMAPDTNDWTLHIIAEPK